MMMKVNIRRLDPSMPLPSYHTDAAAGFDLAARQDMRVEPGAVVLVPTGLVIEVPAGYFLAIIARSSTPLKRGLMVPNGVGVVDPDYCGADDEIKIEIYNFTATPVDITRGDRLAQGLFIPVARAQWVETAGELRDASRGGFGATGR